MTSGGKRNKYWRAKSGMVKMMNLLNNPRGFIEPVMLSLIMHNGCHGIVAGKNVYLGTVGITPFS